MWLGWSAMAPMAFVGSKAWVSERGLCVWGAVDQSEVGPTRLRLEQKGPTSLWSPARDSDGGAG